MGYLKDLFGKSRQGRLEDQSTRVTEKKPASEPKRIGTILYKQEAPELSALEIAEQKDWELKSFAAWESGDEILGTYEVVWATARIGLREISDVG